jgi:hypothetical protein
MADGSQHLGYAVTFAYDGKADMQANPAKENVTGRHIGENSPEQVAFKLMELIAGIEDKHLHRAPGEHQSLADKEWILDTYAECLATVINPNARLYDPDR